MRSLFVRVLLSMWLITTLLAAIFAVIHALAFTPDATQRWRRVSSRTTELRALQALECRRATKDASCADILEPLDDRDPRVAIFQDGVLIMGRSIEGGDELEAIARGSRSNAHASRGDEELVALYIDRGAEGPHVIVSTARRPSRWMFFVVPETLPLRLGAIVLVTGLVSFGLARYLSRPLRTLRAATQRIAGGDWSVRVSPELAGADDEAQALGRELDRMAEKIDGLLGAQQRLLRDVSHELRSPLARLNIALELVRRKASPETSEGFSRIEREAERLDTMIGQLLTLSRLDTEGAVERRQPIDLRALTEAIRDDVLVEAEQKEVRLELHAPEAVELTGDEELLRRAIENVLRNAVRYAPAGTSVKVELRRGADDAAELAVRDHGPGVPHESLEKIFEPFYRVGDDRARGGGGTGLGLAIAARAVALHSGKVGAANHPQGGLVVTLILPTRAAGQ